MRSKNPPALVWTLQLQLIGAILATFIGGIIGVAHGRTYCLLLFPLAVILGFVYVRIPRWIDRMGR